MAKLLRLITSRPTAANFISGSQSKLGHQLSSVSNCGGTGSGGGESSEGGSIDTANELKCSVEAPLISDNASSGLHAEVVTAAVAEVGKGTERQGTSVLTKEGPAASEWCVREYMSCL